MKRIHILESQLIKESYHNEAGTDTPYFYDEKNDVEYSAGWDTDFGYPFGFWDNGIDPFKFSIGSAWSTHINPCGKIAKEYYYNVMYEMLCEDAYSFIDDLDDLIDQIYNDGYTYNEDDDVYVSPDGYDTIDLNDWLCNYDLNAYCNNAYEIVKNAIDNHESPCAEDIADEIASERTEEYNFNDKQGIDNALEEIGSSFDEFFSNGHYQGRIWPYCEMIAFYKEEQPKPDILKDIVRRLSEAGIDTYKHIMDYTMIFENHAHGNGEVTACTVYDYIIENYGDNDEDEEYDDDEEEDNERQYARKGDVKFVPHLANQRQKREFFKDFRKTRDNAVYVPRERAAGSLAAYHAMRYPYGENKDKRNNVIL